MRDVLSGQTVCILSAGLIIYVIVAKICLISMISVISLRAYKIWCVLYLVRLETLPQLNAASSTCHEPSKGRESDRICHIPI